MKLLISNGRVIDPANNLDDVRDIFIKDGKISKISKNIEDDAEKVIDAKNKIVIPGLVDMHVHLRQPGREDKETIATGTRAASKGGVTSLLAMANTTPAIDCPKNIKLLKTLIKNDANVNVLMLGAITKGRQGKEVVDIAGLKKEGVIAVSDDGSSVDDDQIMLEALKKAKKENILVICHCEDKALNAKGVMNLGFMSTKLGLRGISRESEYKRIERDINLAWKAKSQLHIAHVSCAESVRIIAKAKKGGLKITAETAPHYFSLSEEGLSDYNTNMKINPPLRSLDDVAAVKEALASGVIDAIASDHAPHTDNEKAIEFEHAEFGAIGLETELAVSITQLLKPGLLNWKKLVERLSTKPARILGIDKGALSIGADADIVIVDPEKEWVVKKEDFVSKSKNSPFIGKSLKGVVEYTICGGKIVYKNRNDYSE